ncbi:putative bifunctional E2/E3 enzyme R795 [Labeo rohita]|uniref:Bifunctional E2/E3 enzyme R795 n=1 Tax=Labeo rohita TaxID=84645 RepID=A0ABQ8MCM4_LABRO|nr:putative bifunctional E2/E3 enzyme R795 [Labeo rohita]
MDKIFKLLQKFRLDKYYKKFIDLGIKEELDFFDSVNDMTLKSMDFSQAERNRYDNMIGYLQRIGSAPVPEGMPVTKSLNSFHISYRFPKCPGIQEITGSLNDRHIASGSELYAIFTRRENLTELPPTQRQANIRNEGPSVIRCHIMLQGDFEIKVDFESDTLRDVTQRLSLESSEEYNHVDKLSELGITEDSVLQFYLSSYDNEKPSPSLLFQTDVRPSVKQTKKGLSVFLSTLYAVKLKHCGDDFKKVVAYIRRLSGCNALAQSLFQMICRNFHIALVEGLYFLFRELLPGLNERSGPKVIEDGKVFEYANICWAYLIGQGQNESDDLEYYATISLKTYPTGQRLSEPVRVPGTPEVFDRSYILEKITDGVRIPNCEEENLLESSIQRATDIEKILLSLPASFDRFPLWIFQNSTPPGCNFQIEQKKTFSDMFEDVKQFSHLIITPPLQLANMGTESPLLVYLSEDNLGVYLNKDKGDPFKIRIYDCLSGKETTKNVLFDSSSSMMEECYDTVSQMKRIDAVKQIFDSFSNRSMSYDFQHVICLVMFNDKVKTLLKFTENLEAFKEQVHAIEASGYTRLYDALVRGIAELDNIKKRFPACRCRILCLTDGNDFSSMSNPVTIARKLVNSNIVVDAVIVGEADNTVLHGISHVTGGYCFKPENAKAALKLFEMETVLSMELRAERTREDLTRIFATHGYDERPEMKLPAQITKKAARTENVLKKKIRESKSGRFMEKEKRIIEELKSLHCDPHPFCSVYPSETDFTFWRIVMKGPPDTPYENGTFELYCQFGDDYPVKPPVVRFYTPVSYSLHSVIIYHCNINSVGRICHNIFDRHYSADVTMREILDAVYGLLIVPEAEDPLDSILAEEFLTSKESYEQAAKDATAINACQSMEFIEKQYIGESNVKVPPHLVCPLTGKIFIDPVKAKSGCVYERRAIEEYLKTNKNDPVTGKPLSGTDLTPDKNMKKSVMEYRTSQIEETDP